MASRAEFLRWGRGELVSELPRNSPADLDARSADLNKRWQACENVFAGKNIVMGADFAAGHDPVVAFIQDAEGTPREGPRKLTTAERSFDVRNVSGKVIQLPSGVRIHQNGSVRMITADPRMLELLGLQRVEK